MMMIMVMVMVVVMVMVIMVIVMMMEMMIMMDRDHMPNRLLFTPLQKQIPLCIVSSAHVSRFANQ